MLHTLASDQVQLAGLGAIACATQMQLCDCRGVKATCQLLPFGRRLWMSLQKQKKQAAPNMPGSDLGEELSLCAPAGSQHLLGQSCHLFASSAIEQDTT